MSQDWKTFRNSSVTLVGDTPAIQFRRKLVDTLTYLQVR